MKKIALTLAFLIGSVASAAAACTGPAVMHDFPGTSFNMSLATTPDGNCGSNVAITTWGGISLGAASNYGTSPGAVAVPGVNAFITNVPAVSQSGTWTVQPGNTANTTAWLVTGTGGTFPSTQSGTWTVQPGNTANTTPWLASISQGGNTAIVKAGNTFAGTEQAVGVAVTNTLASVTPGDGITTTVYGTAPAAPVIGSALLWNGATYDRLRSAGGTGFAGVNPGTPANWGIAATAAAVPANAMYNGALDAVGGTNLVGLAADPCQTSVKTTVPITLATATVKVIATGVSAKKIYVCQINLNNNAADSVAIFEATTATTCATAAVAVIGAGTSVATAAPATISQQMAAISIGAGGQPGLAD
jgi:hypothetical protein